MIDAKSFYLSQRCLASSARENKDPSLGYLLILVAIANNSWPVICPIRSATILGNDTKTLSDEATSTCVSFVALRPQAKMGPQQQIHTRLDATLLFLALVSEEP